jgi:hypothetical protein
LRDHAAVDTPALPAEPFDERGAVRNLASGLPERPPPLARHAVGEIFGVGRNELEPWTRDRRTLTGRLGTPHGQSSLGRRGRTPSLFEPERRHGGHALPSGQVGHRNRPTVGRREPFPSDVTAVS